MSWTVEMRWFARGVPFEMPEMFSAISDVSICHDFYACLHPKCGLKLRDKKIEMKLLHSNIGVCGDGEKVGKAQKWQKWTFFTESNCPTKQQLLPCDWLAVKKKETFWFFL